jgi:hypothetical protein
MPLSPGEKLGPYEIVSDVIFEYDVTADGKRFLINTVGGPGAAPSPPLTVVTNWTAGLKK